MVQTKSISLSDRLRRRLAEPPLPPVTIPSDAPSITDKNRAMQMLTCKRTRLYEMRQEGLIEFVKIGKLSAVLTASIYAAIERGRIK
jgi:hypothetical protein